MLDGRAVELDACRDLGISIFAGEAEGRLEACYRTRPPAGSRPIYNFMNDLPGLEGTVVPFPPEAICDADARAQHELRRRPRLSLSVLVLHHHQRARAQVALPFGR